METNSIGIAGTGSCVPVTEISNDAIASLIRKPDKGGPWAEQKLGIESRRFMTTLDSDTGRPTSYADELDMAERAARHAIAGSGLLPGQVDALWYISCTQKGNERHHFSNSAFELHARLGLTESAIPLEMDAGCGGAVHAIGLGEKMIKGNGWDTMLIVAANAPSRYYDSWEAYVSSEEWLPMYIFGDGAGAVLLRRTEKTPNRTSKILSSYLRVDPKNKLMYYEPRGNDPDPLYIIDGRAVAAGFGIYARRALDGLKKQSGVDWKDVDRFYFHQVNGKVLLKFVDGFGIPREKVSMHVSRYGNIAAAATLVLLDEDRKKGVVSDGDLCVFCTVGAGAQYGALLVQL